MRKTHTQVFDFLHFEVGQGLRQPRQNFQINPVAGSKLDADARQTPARLCKCGQIGFPNMVPVRVVPVIQYQAGALQHLAGFGIFKNYGGRQLLEIFLHAVPVVHLDQHGVERLAGHTFDARLGLHQHAVVGNAHRQIESRRRRINLCRQGIVHIA